MDLNPLSKSEENPGTVINVFSNEKILQIYVVN